MNDKTASQKIDLDNIRYRAARMFTQTILRTLQDFIPRACQREAEQRLFKMAYDHELELTTLDVRKELAVIKSTMLEGLHHELLGHPQEKAAKPSAGT